MTDNDNIEVIAELKRGSFRRAVSRVTKAAPSCENIGLVFKKESSDMFIVASPSSTKYDVLYEDISPHFDVCVTIHNVKGTIPFNIMANRIALAAAVENARHSDDEKIFLSIKDYYLYLSYTDSSARYRTGRPIADMTELMDQLKPLKPKKYADEIQIEDFHMYFRETRHVLDARFKNNLFCFSFYLEIDTENNIRVTALSPSHISVRGYIVGEIKYSFCLLKPDMVRIAAFFDKEPVTIHIPKKKDNNLYLTAKDAVASIPVVSHFQSPLSHYVSWDEKPLLTLTLKKEELLLLIKNIIGYGVPPRIIIKGNTLEVFCGSEDGASPTGHYKFDIVMEKSPDIDIAFQIDEKKLYDAVRQINAHFVKFMFMPKDRLIVTDYHRNFRMLPHTLKSLEVIGLQKDSFHVL